MLVAFFDLGVKFVYNQWIPFIHVNVVATLSVHLVLVFGMALSCVDIHVPPNSSKINHLHGHMAVFLKNFDQKIQSSKTDLSNFYENYGITTSWTIFLDGDLLLPQMV